MIALITAWTALLLVSTAVIIYPIPGTGIWITLANVLSSGLTAPLLGPAAGSVSGLILGLGAPYINPVTSMGILTFLTTMLGPLVAGLTLFNRWKEAAAVIGLEIAIWFANPFSWYRLMPIVSWEYWLALILVVTPPIRRRIIGSIVHRDPRRLVIALWCLAWVDRIGGNVITGNNIAIWVLGWTFKMYEFWAPMTVYYAIVDFLNCLGGAVIGTGVLLMLKRTGFRILALDWLESRGKGTEVGGQKKGPSS